MNRILLIGNGFDLANGMKTSYTDFLNDYWKNSFSEYKMKKYPFKSYECDNFIISSSNYSLHSDCENYNDVREYLATTKCNFKIKNTFLQLISEKLQLKNWVDIEQEFYSNLLSSLNSRNDDEDNPIRTLNGNLNNIKGHLEKYLIKTSQSFTIVNEIQNYISQEIYSKIKYSEISEDAKNKLFEQSWNSMQDALKTKSPLNKSSVKPLPLSALSLLKLENMSNRNLFFKALHDNSDKILDNTSGTIFVNFNYTKTEDYFTSPESRVIHIHGELDNNDNPIIFGYGDEYDENYSKIENCGNDRFLENMKSINYSQTGNYKNLLSTLNEDFYQVCILGHSCGKSDRTLLKTMFEHENCASIKIYFREFEKDGKLYDNYLDIYKSISRNFDDKTKLRDRVVNKTLCKPIVPIDIQKRNLA